MALADAAKQHGPTREKGWSSKVDDVLALMEAEDADTFRTWLHDPDWTSHSITKALERHSMTEGKDFTMGHSTIERWRMHHGIKVNPDGAR